MTVIYAMSMNKGGVGKTSLVSNLSGAISKKMKKKILIIDTDGQGNSSIAFGLNPSNYENTIYDVLLGHQTAESVIVHIDKYIDIIPANEDMNFLEFDILRIFKSTSTHFIYSKTAYNQFQANMIIYS